MSGLQRGFFNRLLGLHWQQQLVLQELAEDLSDLQVAERPAVKWSSDSGHRRPLDNFHYLQALGSPGTPNQRKSRRRQCTTRSLCPAAGSDESARPACTSWLSATIRLELRPRWPRRSKCARHPCAWNCIIFLCHELERLLGQRAHSRSECASPRPTRNPRVISKIEETRQSHRAVHGSCCSACSRPPRGGSLSAKPGTEGPIVTGRGVSAAEKKDRKGAEHDRSCDASGNLQGC